MTSEGLKRDWILWVWGGCVLVGVALLVLLLTTGFQAGTEFAREVSNMKAMRATPQPTFSLSWVTDDNFSAMQCNPRRETETVREHVERTLADAREALTVLPKKEGK